MLTGLTFALRRRWRIAVRLLGRRWCGVLIAVFIFYIVVNILVRPKRIPVFVVEEHHEVIPYWFKAVEDGLIPKSGNTLIHIDGHSDEGLPYYSDMSFFKWPTTDGTIENMMQRNDVFVQAAVMTGLISRFIFIRPSWDLRMRKWPRLATFDVVLGWLERNQSQRAYCSCMMPIDNKMHVNCRSDEGDWLPTWNCNAARRYISQVVLDKTALHRLTQLPPSNWPQLSDGAVILDIDEDYFGCELASTSLLKQGVKWEHVEMLSNFTEQLFCPTRIEHESWANAMMRAVVSAVTTACGYPTTDGHCPMSENEVYSNMAPVVDRYRRKYPSLSCEKGSETKFWRGIAAALSQMRRSDMKAVADLGFCLTSSTAGNGGSRGAAEISVCAGRNTPDNNMVFVHTATRRELQSRMTDLATMLDRLHARADTRPSLVTICRSVRDGYTPRSQFVAIESGIVDIFTKELGGDYDVFYDVNLLGGKRGWPSRHDVRPVPRDPLKWVHLKYS